ncbi:MAG: hypothetical protein QNJ46_25125 [Leptolyngbyaceae cyanobacterium MO_188.B28]|nr:hypothetical protein [Leptolyngbyaceae cyanobacterium MO_188.B28]
MADNPILAAIEEVVSLQDGVAEYTGPNVLETLLPKEVAKALSVKEEVAFTTSAEDRNSYFVTYNSEILAKFESLLNQQGYVATFGIHYGDYLKTTGFDKIVAESLHPLNGLIRVIDANPRKTSYILCNVAYTATADEKRIGMISFFMNELTGVAPAEVGDALLWESDQIAIAPLDDQTTVPFDHLSDIIANTAERLINQDLENWRKSLNRKQGRDEERLRAYYGAIKREIRAKIKKRHLSGEDEERELARIKATDMELKRKLADLAERYSLRIEAQLHSALVVLLQTVHVECELVRKKHKRRIIAIWNPYLKTIEPLRCEKSGVPVKSFYLADADAQILSTSVWEDS